MITNPKILALAGSTRRESFNKKLAKIVAAGAEAKGASVTFLDLADYPLPLYDGDLEANEGVPENAVKLMHLFHDAEGFLIASPEYNGSISAVLKNAIDWVSRPPPGNLKLVPYRGKTAALVAASPGSLGGLRGMVHVRQILTNLGVTVIPDQRAVNGAAQAFDGSGALKDEALHIAIEGIGQQLCEVASRLSGPTAS